MGERENDFAEALRDAVAARGLSLDRVRAHLLSYGHDVSVATLSYWQTGRSVPVRRASLQALGALEVILQVPRGFLAQKLPSQQSRRPGPRGSWRRTTTQPIDISAGVRVAQEWGIGWNDGYTVVAHDTWVQLGRDRTLDYQSIVDTIIAERDGFDRLLIGYLSDVPGVLMEVSAVAGCRVGRVATIMAETFTIAELILDYPLRSGEPYRFEYRTSYDQPGVYNRVWEHLHMQRLRNATLTLAVDPDDPPHTVTTFIGGLEDPEQVVPAELRGPDLTIFQRDFGPGRLVIRWGWDDDPAEPIQPIRAGTEA